MPQLIRCPFCTQPMQVPDNAAGKQVICPGCKKAITIGAASASPSPESITRPALAKPRSNNVPEPILEREPVDNILEVEPVYAYFKDNGALFINAHGLAEAKIALRDVRAMKKALALRKRQVTQKQRMIRAQYTHQIRQRLPK